MGDDHLSGEDGDDTLFGRDGEDELRGGPHRDTLYGGNGPDYLVGGKGDDTLRGEDGGDTLDGRQGNDACFGGNGIRDELVDATCEIRSGAERLLPKYDGSNLSCGPNDTSCLSFSGFNGQSVAGYPLCNQHNCTAYAAYRLSERGLSTDQIPRGNAYQWDNNPGALNIKLEPAPGDIAQWETLGSTASNNCNGVNCGHVAYVERVNKNSAGAIVSMTISESSWCTGGKVRDINVGSSSWPTRFLRLR